MWKVVNNSGQTLYVDWNTSILSDEDLALWEQEKKKEGFGKPVDSSLIPPNEATLLDNWCMDNAVGVQIRLEPSKVFPRGGVARRFVIPEKADIFVNDRQKEYLASVWGEKKLKQKLQPGQLTHAFVTEGFLDFEKVPEKKEELVEGLPATFTCPDCGKVFETKAKLQGHKISHRK